MLKLYGDRDAIDSYKLRLMLSLLKKNYTWFPSDQADGFPQVLKDQYGEMPLPCLLSDEGWLLQANAILYAIAEESHFLPAKAVGRNRALQWLFFERERLRPSYDRALHDGGTLEAQDSFRTALRIFEFQLAQTRFAVSNQVSLADIAMYPVISQAADVQVDLKAYPQICLWMDDIQSLNGFKTKANLS